MARPLRVYIGVVNRHCMQSSMMVARVADYAARNGWYLARTIDTADVAILVPCLFDGKHTQRAHGLLAGMLGTGHGDLRVFAVGCAEGLQEHARDGQLSVVPHGRLDDLDEHLEAAIPLRDVRGNLLHLGYRPGNAAADSFAWNVDLCNTCVNDCALRHQARQGRLA